MNNKTLFLAWITSIIATLGSLYLSEIKGFNPCTLCWYQRILMYPQVIILGIAFYKGDHRVWGYTLPMSLLGWAIALYHYIIQKSPKPLEFAACSVDVPCSGQYINWFGFITIPFLSFTAFTIISICMFILYKKNKKEEKES